MKKILIFFATLSCVLTVNGQDPHFLNTNQSLVYLNPSFAGTNGYIRNQASYRNQWPNLSGNYKTYLNTFDAYVKPLKAGVAVSLMSDDQLSGTLKVTTASLVYAQHISCMDGNLKVIPSVQLSYGIRTLDVNNLHFGDAFDPRYGIVWSNPTALPTSNKSYFDASTGLLVNYKNLYVGASVFHFNQPDIGLLGTYKLPALFSFNASYNKAVSERMLLNFSGRLTYQQKNTIGKGAVSIIYKSLIAGLGYGSPWTTGYHSPGTAFINAGFRSGIFTAMIGYDRNVGQFYNSFNSAGSWELMFSFNFRKETPKGVITNPEVW